MCVEDSETVLNDSLRPGVRPFDSRWCLLLRVSVFQSPALVSCFVVRYTYVIAPISEFHCLSNEAEYGGYPAVAFRNETRVNVCSELEVLLLDTVH